MNEPSAPDGETSSRRPAVYLFWFGSLAAALALFLLELILGSVKIPIADVLKIFVGIEPAKASWQTIIAVFRLPRAITACLAGAGLAVCGLQMQTLFHNPLAGPSILGISSGASLGVALVVLGATTTDASRFLDGLGIAGEAAMVIASGAGATAVLLVFLFASRRVKSVVTLLILGLLFGYATNAVVSILMHFSISERIQAYINWTFGSFSGTTWRQLSIFAPVGLATMFVVLLSNKALNGLLLGESYAQSMGLHIKRTRGLLIATTAILTGTITAFCGPVAFLGVAVPHLARGVLNTSNHRKLLPASALLGAVMALFADLVAHLPGTSIVLPLNAVTALIGAPVVGWVILKRRALREAFS
ncbi:MAG: iron ABC transporter permease [Spirochaetales bacterium]|nr:iron ABC transporter permease [Spirochaetales bacterium]